MLLLVLGGVVFVFILNWLQWEQGQNYLLVFFFFLCSFYFTSELRRSLSQKSLGNPKRSYFQVIGCDPCPSNTLKLAPKRINCKLVNIYCLHATLLTSPSSAISCSPVVSALGFHVPHYQHENYPQDDSGARVQRKHRLINRRSHSLLVS